MRPNAAENIEYSFFLVIWLKHCEKHVGSAPDIYRRKPMRGKIWTVLILSLLQTVDLWRLKYKCYKVQ